jgi:hypothetical protein
VGRIGAEREFKRAIDRGAAVDDVVAAAARYAADPQRRSRGDRYTKNPVNWLADGYWADRGKTGGVIDQHGNSIGGGDVDDIEAMVEGILATGWNINGFKKKDDAS